MDDINTKGREMIDYVIQGYCGIGKAMQRKTNLRRKCMFPHEFQKYFNQTPFASVARSLCSILKGVLIHSTPLPPLFFHIQVSFTTVTVAAGGAVFALGWLSLILGDVFGHGFTEAMDFVEKCLFFILVICMR